MNSHQPSHPQCLLRPTEFLIRLCLQSPLTAAPFFFLFNSCSPLVIQQQEGRVPLSSRVLPLEVFLSIS